jgi:hypothetical protein
VSGAAGSFLVMALLTADLIRLRYPSQPMTLTIRIPKTSPSIGRREAAELAKEIALNEGHSDKTLRRVKSRIEASDGVAPWEYVIEFPDTTS